MKELIKNSEFMKFILDNTVSLASGYIFNNFINIILKEISKIDNRAEFPAEIFREFIHARNLMTHPKNLISNPTSLILFIGIPVCHNIMARNPVNYALSRIDDKVCSGLSSIHDALSFRPLRLVSGLIEPTPLKRAATNKIINTVGFFSKSSVRVISNVTNRVANTLYKVSN